MYFRYTKTQVYINTVQDISSYKFGRKSVCMGRGGGTNKGNKKQKTCHKQLLMNNVVFLYHKRERELGGGGGGGGGRGTVRAGKHSVELEVLQGGVVLPATVLCKVTQVSPWKDSIIIVLHSASIPS